MIEPEGSPAHWPPLGLPTGSVRALLTLTVVAVVVASLATGRELDLLWIETLLIALAHYFTSRRFVSLPPSVRQRLEQEGVLDKELHPLYLPRHSIRTIILASFIGLGIYLYHEGRLFDPRPLSVLGMVFAYLLGAIVRGITGWFARRRTSRPSRFWGDTRAIIALLAVAVAAIPEWLGQAQVLPPEVNKIALAIVLFYFGSR